MEICEQNLKETKTFVCTEEIFEPLLQLSLLGAKNKSVYIFIECLKFAFHHLSSAPAEISDS